MAKKNYLSIAIIINNGVDKEKVLEHIHKFNTWLKKQLSTNIFCHIFNSNFTDLELKIINKDNKNWIILKDIKERLRQTFPFLATNSTHAVIFIYSLEQTINYDNNWYTSSWTYINPFTPQGQDPFIEICLEQTQVMKEGLYNTLTHEIIHALIRRAWYLGCFIKDDMDLYDLDNDVELSTKEGNRRRNLDRILQHKDIILSEPKGKNTLVIILATLIKQSQDKILSALRRQNKKEYLINKMAEAIKEMEGYFEGSRSYKNNNPGNLRFTEYTKSLGARRPDADNFAVFPDYETGYNALKQFLRDAFDNKLRNYRDTMTLIEFFSVYTPKTDNNNPVNYAYFVSKKIGYPPDKPIKDYYLN